MSIKELRKKSYEIHNKNRLNNWIIAISFILLSGAFFSLGLLASTFIIFVIPLVVLPLFFSFCLYHYVQSGKIQLTGKNVFSFTKLYVSPRFYGCLRFFYCFLISLLINIIVDLIAGFIIFFIFNATRNPDFIDSINALREGIGKVSDETVLNNLINGKNNVLAEYYFWSGLFGNCAFFMCFIYLVLKGSITIVYRAHIVSTNMYIFKKASKFFYRNNKKNILRCFWGLNWPLFVVMLLAYSGAIAICYFNVRDISLNFVIAELSAFVSMVFFLPFVFSNNEVIAEECQDGYLKAFGDAVNDFSRFTGGYVNASKNDYHKDVVSSQEPQENKQEEEPKEEKKEKHNPLDDYGGGSGIDFD